MLADFQNHAVLSQFSAIFLSERKILRHHSLQYFTKHKTIMKNIFNSLRCMNETKWWTYVAESVSLKFLFLKEIFGDSLKFCAYLWEDWRRNQTETLLKLISSYVSPPLKYIKGNEMGKNWHFKIPPVITFDHKIQWVERQIVVEADKFYKLWLISRI